MPHKVQYHRRRILGNNQIGPSQQVNEADGIGQGAFLQQVDDGISEIGKGNHRRLGKHDPEKCLLRGQADGDRCLVLSSIHRFVGGAEYLGHIGTKEKSECNNDKDRPGQIVHIYAEFRFHEFGQAVENNEQKDNRRCASDDVGIPIRRHADYPVS